MKRFIFVSFAFLAWVFYELSGGADFQPRVAANPPAPTTKVASTANPAKATPVKAAVLVATPAIQKPEPVAPAPVPAVAEAEAEPVIETAAQLDQIRTSLSQGLSLFPDTNEAAQPLILASLEQGAAGLGTAPVAEEEPVAEVAQPTPPKADIREITGSRVNMRDGPGTIYPVIKKLTVGHEVEVLDDSGTGWLRLRTLPGQQIGWISASLVSKGKP